MGDLETWMKVCSIATLFVAPAMHCIVVLCAKMGAHRCYQLGVRLHWVSGLVILAYCLYGLHLYENSTDVMCYDGSGLNPMVIMRVLWILLIVCCSFACVAVGCVCCGC